MNSEDAFSPGSTITHDGRPLRLEARLNAGLTGEVFEGWLEEEHGVDTHVAVKVMKALDFPMARAMFMKESEVLAHLEHVEDSANKEQDTVFKIAPHYYGRGERGDIPYLVMEFIDGVPLPELLQKLGSLPERQALTIAWHLFRTLDLMHSKLGKTYIDLKLENLWWVEKAEQGEQEYGQLKLTDFGTLDDIHVGSQSAGRGIRRDILLGHIYLCAFVTGRMLKFAVGELNEPSEPVLRESEVVTWGTRQLLRRGLHRNIQARPESAAEVSEKLWELATFWSKGKQELLKIADLNLAKAEASDDPRSQDVKQLSERAMAALAIARAQDSEDPDELVEKTIQRAEDMLAVADYLERGKQLFHGASYPLARQTFNEGMDWSDDPAVLRRWSYLAQIGEDLPNDVFDKDVRKQAVQALERLNEDKFDQAAERLETLAERASTAGLTSTGVEALQADCHLFRLLEESDQARADGAYGQVAEKIREAREWLERLPDSEFVQHQEVGDLLLKQEQAENLMQTREQASEHMREALGALTSAEPSRALALVRSAFEADRETGHVSLVNLVDEAITQKHYSLAVSLADVGIYDAQVGSSLLVSLGLARQLTAATEALRQHDAEGLREALMGVLGEYLEHPEARPSTLHLVNQAGEQARAAEDFELLKSLASIGGTLPNEGTELETKFLEWAHDIEEQHQKRLESSASRQYERALELLALDDPARAEEAAIDKSMADLAQLRRGQLERLDQALRLLRDAMVVAGEHDPRYVEIETRLHEVQQQREGLSVRLTATERLSDREREERLYRLERDWERLERLRDWAASEQTAGPDAGLYDEIKLHLKEGIQQFLFQCQAYLEEIDPREPRVTAWCDQAKLRLSEYGLRAWEEVKQLAVDEIKSQSASSLGPLEEKYHAGGVLEVRHELALLEWKTRVARADVLNEWHRDHAKVLASTEINDDLIEQTRRFLAMEIPAVLWADSPVPQYLHAVEPQLRDDLDRLMPQSSKDEFVDALKRWLRVVMLRRLADRRQGLQDDMASAAWDARRFIEEACKATSGPEPLASLQAVVGKTALPGDVASALNAITPGAWTQTLQTIRAKTEREKSQRARERNQLWMLWGVGIVVAAVLIGGAALLGGWMQREVNREAMETRIAQTAAVTAVQLIEPTIEPTAELASPVAVIQALASTGTPGPSVVPSATPASPSPTSLPTPTDTPVPLLPERSAFQLEVEGAIALQPPVPVTGSDFIALMNDDSLQANPSFDDAGVWVESVTADAEHFFVTTTGDVSLAWELDVYLDDGTYQIYFLDTLTSSTGRIVFDVQLEGMTAAPIIGSGEIILNSNVDAESGGQTKDNWISIGAYAARRGQRLRVSTSVGSRDETNPFAVDRLLIVRVPPRELEKLARIPQGRPLATFIDEGSVSFRALLGNQFVNVPSSFELATVDSAVNQQMYFSTKDPGGTILVEWPSIQRLSAGRYQLLAWFPSEHATANAEYSLLADGIPVPRQSPKSDMDQAHYNEEWVDLGLWELKSEAAVGVRMEVASGFLAEGHEIGVDAVAVLRAD